MAYSPHQQKLILVEIVSIDRLPVKINLEHEKGTIQFIPQTHKKSISINTLHFTYEYNIKKRKTNKTSSEIDKVPRLSTHNT